MDGIPPALVQHADLGGLLALLIVALLRGWIVMGKTHDEQMADQREQVKTWRETATKAQAAAEKMTASGELAGQLLRGLMQQAQAKGGDEK